MKSIKLTNQQKKLEEYLRQHYTKSTVQSYYRHIMIYLKEQPEAKTSNYKDVVSYLWQLRKKYTNSDTVKTILNAIKKYYEYLLFTRQRSDHPCRSLNIKDKRSKDIQIQDLLNEASLESLLYFKRKGCKSVLDIRNKSILSLLIYQGLTKGEVTHLTTGDLNLERGSIYIKSGVASNSRTLELNSNQVLLLYNYVNNVRPKLLLNNINPIETDILFITIYGFPDSKGVSIKHLLENIEKQGGIKAHTRLIRKSVIALKLKKGNDIRMVQSFAGHKNASSTERYKNTDIEELKQGIQKYHPLNS